MTPIIRFAVADEQIQELNIEPYIVHIFDPRSIKKVFSSSCTLFSISPTFSCTLYDLVL